MDEKLIDYLSVEPRAAAKPAIDNLLRQWSDKFGNRKYRLGGGHTYEPIKVELLSIVQVERRCWASYRPSNDQGPPYR